jgi:iron-sulfur cluster repair protein YtfE (RIC family)
LLEIGSKRRSTPDGIVDALLDCHARIRKFTDVASRLAEAREPTVDEVRDAAHRVARYFEEALPRHVQDEEHTVLPRLEGLDSSVDAALASMHEEHEAHLPHLATLIATCKDLQASPARLDELRDRLGTVAATLSRDFGAHLEQEERVIFPALTHLLTPSQHAEMLAELRGRRD